MCSDQEISELPTQTVKKPKSLHEKLWWGGNSFLLPFYLQARSELEAKGTSAKFGNELIERPCYSGKHSKITQDVPLLPSFTSLSTQVQPMGHKGDSTGQMFFGPRAKWYIPTYILLVTAVTTKTERPHPCCRLDHGESLLHSSCAPEGCNECHSTPERFSGTVEMWPEERG